MSRHRVLAFTVAAGAVVSLDQITKALVRASFEMGESRPVIEGVLWLTRVHNTGAAFGLLRGKQWLLIAVAALVLIAVGYVFIKSGPRNGAARAGLALIAGGAIGNLIDRIAACGVTDFFDLGWFPVFNVADIALDVGVVLLAYWILFGGEHHATDPAAASAEPGSECGEGAPGLEEGAS